MLLTAHPPSRLCYVLGASHSGTTLLAMLLGAHPECCTVGQLGAEGLTIPGRYRCSCGRPVRECSFWEKVRAAMKRRGLDFDIVAPRTSIHAAASGYLRCLLQPLHRAPQLEILRDAALSLSPRWRKHLNDVQQRYAALVGSVLEVTGTKLVVDSSKTGLRLKYLLRNADLDIKVIWFVRDGRGVALTYLDPLHYADATDPELRAGGSGGHRDDERKSMVQAAREWRRSNEEAECVVARMSRSRWIQARYEDLCQNPRHLLARLCDFIGVDPARVNLDFRSPPQHVIGNGMRLDATSDIILDERWRTSLSPENLRLFDRVAGDLNRRYHYV